MKKITIFLFLFLFNLDYAYSSKYKNNIVLKVENEIVTSFEIKNKILGSLLLSNQEINQKNIDKLKEQALNSLIQYKLKKIELANHNFADDKKQINTYLASISSNDIDGLKRKFKNYDLDFQLFLDEIKTQLKWQRLIYKIYSNKIDINDNVINQELESLKKDNSNLEEFKLSEIEILSNNDDTDLKLISKVQDQIINFGFEATALKFSISSSSNSKGEIGWINAKSLTKEIYQIVRKMKIGDVSKPIKRQGSLLFLKLNDKKMSKVENINLEEMREKLINQKKNELFNLYSRSHLSKLKNTSLIEYK